MQVVVAVVGKVSPYKIRKIKFHKPFGLPEGFFLAAGRYHGIKKKIPLLGEIFMQLVSVINCSLTVFSSERKGLKIL